MLKKRPNSRNDRELSQNAKNYENERFLDGVSYEKSKENTGFPMFDREKSQKKVKIWSYFGLKSGKGMEMC